jgi:hypothetical protein
MNEMLFFYGVCWYGIKSLQHVKVWKIGGIHEKSMFEDFEKMFQQRTRLNYDTFHSLITVVGSSIEQKNTHTWEKTSLLKLE